MQELLDLVYYINKMLKIILKSCFFATRAAKAGNPKAQFDLAIMYASGKGVKKDERMAFYWFHKSARGGNIEAKYYMGLSFEQGRGVKPNPHLARYWFKQALKGRHPKALYHLSQIEAFLNNKNRNHYSMR
jgi:TPR repeat protein